MNAYFDYAAATPMLPEVIAAMRPYYTDKFYNPSALYLAARAVKEDVQAARATIASAIGAKPNEIIFTAGGTEANNLAITGVAQQFNDAHIVTSAIEHESVLQPVHLYSHSCVPVNEQGIVRLDKLSDAITDNTVLVSVMLVNNEIGTIQDIKAIAKLVADIKINRQKQGNTRPLYIHTDACQAVNYLDIHVARLGVDMMTVNAGKIYGPKQSGILYIRSGTTVLPMLHGGGQERNLRSGTQNVANIIGFAQAIQTVRTDVAAETKRIEQLQKHIMSSLVDNKSIRLNGTRLGRRLVNNIHITINGIDNERLLMELDERGVQVATGSACSASNDEPSHVLSAIGLDQTQIRSSIRITLGRHTTVDHCNLLVHSLKELVAKN
jgi:cysteine desulfurase